MNRRPWWVPVATFGYIATGTIVAGYINPEYWTPEKVGTVVWHQAVAIAVAHLTWR